MSLNIFRFFLLSLFTFQVAAANENEEASSLSKIQQSAQILNRAFKTFNQAKDTGKFIESLKKDKIEVSPEARAFFVKEFNSPAPTAYNVGEALYLDFADGSKVKIEAPSKDIVLINGIKVDVSNVDSMQTLKSQIVTALKNSNQSSMLDKILNQLFPYAHAGVGSFLTQNAGLVVAAVGMVLAIKDKKALGLSMIAGGVLFHVLKDKPSH